MKPCVRCHRHVRRAEPLCPFCGAALVDAPAPPPRAAWGLGAALLVACGPGQPPAESESTAATSSASTDPGTTTGNPDSTTTTPTTAPLPGTSTGTTTTTTTCGCMNECDAGDESGGFIYGSPGPDFGIDLDCDIYAQDCCPGLKCAPWSHDGSAELNGTHCVPITGDQQPGEPCNHPDPPDAPPSGSDDCRPGALCVDIDDMQQGTCIELCSDATPPCTPGRVCLTNNGVFPLCLPSCDPLAQDCPAGDTCIPASDGFGFGCAHDVSGDEGQANDPCQFVNACDPGLMCLDAATASAACKPATSCCQPFCEFPGAPCPNPDQQCIQWFLPDQIPPGDEHLGVCAVPF